MAVPPPGLPEWRGRRRDEANGRAQDEYVGT